MLIGQGAVFHWDFYYRPNHLKETVVTTQTRTGSAFQLIIRRRGSKYMHFMNLFCELLVQFRLLIPNE